MKKKSKLIIPLLLAASLATVAGISWSKSRQDKFAAVRSEGPELEFRVVKQNALMAVTGNLKYYGVVKDEDALLYALEHTKDEKPGKEGALKVGNNDIDIDSFYKISQTMDTWEIARILLNEGEPIVARGHGPDPTGGITPELAPGGDVMPDWKTRMQVKYEWVDNYENCVEARGSDGGQLSSEQYYERTGERWCVSPDGRVFKEGVDGWTENMGG